MTSNVTGMSIPGTLLGRKLYVKRQLIDIGSMSPFRTGLGAPGIASHQLHSTFLDY